MFYVYLAVLLLACIIGVSRYPKQDSASKVIILLLILTFFSESLAIVFKKLSITSYPVYHIYSVVELQVISVFFTRTGLKRRHSVLPWVFLVTWILLATCNALFFQSIYSLNSNILVLESFIIIGMALYALKGIMTDDALENVTTYNHFWTWAILLLFWSFNYVFWGCYQIFAHKGGAFFDTLKYMQVYINIIVYGGMGVILLMFPKRVK